MWAGARAGRRGLDPHALRIRAIVSGEVLQDSTTANLIFGVDDVISHASQTMTSSPAT